MITAGTAMKHTHDAMRQPPNAESSEPPRPIAERVCGGRERRNRQRCGVPREH